MVRTLCFSRWAALALVAVILSAAPLSALADMIPPIVRVSNGTTTFEVPAESFVFDPETNQFQSTGSVMSPGAFEFGWDLTTNPDPFVVGTISMLNMTASPQNYTLTYIQPVNPTLNSPTTSQGSIEIGVQNVDGGTAVLTTAGLTPIYQAKIDGVTQNTLLNTATLTSTGSQGLVSTTAAFGPIYGGPAVFSDIGIEVNFSLTSFDLASGTVFYSVVPEPSTLATVGLGMLAMFGLAWVRRRG